MNVCLAEFFESGAITSLSKDKLLIGWGPSKRLTAKEIDPSKPAFYFTDFFLTLPRPWIQYSNWAEILRVDFQEQLLSAELPNCSWSIHQPQQFKIAFDQLSLLLQKGELKKGVPYLFTTSSTPMHPKRLQTCLKRGLAILEKSAGYVYGHWDSSSGVLGVTPELLFSYDGREHGPVHTMALAGTCSPDQTPDSFLKNEKERHEHQLVVEGICQSLHLLGMLKIGEIQLLKLPKLTHLMTPIEIELNQSFDFEKMVKALHPTPALGAFPVKEGRKWLLHFQNHTPRHYYGAPIGFQYSQSGLKQCFVGIRNVQWDKSGMRIGAGCGVVKQSTFEKEWNEIQLKIRAIRDQLYL